MQSEREGSEKTLVDDDCLQRQISELLRERDILQATIRLQDKTIGNQQRTIETQRTTIEAGDTTIAMLKRQWIGEQRISKRIRKETRELGKQLLELGK